MKPKLRWFRVDPGRYACGEWVITGKGTKWELLRKGRHVCHGHSKGELQRRVAEGDADAPDDVDAPDAPEPRAPRRGVASTDSLESVIASLRLEVNELTLAVRMLNARLDRETR